MQSSSIATPNEVQTSPLYDQDLTKYCRYKSFNLFLYSRTATSTPLFLLHKTSDSSIFAHFSGSFTKHDPAIYFSIAREIITKTSGLLQKENLKYFLAKNSTPLLNVELINETDRVRPYRAQKGWSPAVIDICDLLCGCPYIYQDKNECVSYYIEMPMLSVGLMGEAAVKNKIDFEAKYYTLDEILDPSNEEIAKNLPKCFNDDQNLLYYAQRYIVKNEPVEIKSRFAILRCDPTLRNSIIPSLHYSAYKKHSEEWTIYRAYEGEYPTEEELRGITGILIPGSGNAAYETNVPWFKETV